MTSLADQIAAIQRMLNESNKMRERTELQDVLKTLTFIARPNIQAAIREAHTLERVKKNIEEHFPGAEMIEREPE